MVTHDSKSDLPLVSRRAGVGMQLVQLTLEDGAELSDQCFHAIRKALALKPKDHTLWNILGVFALHHEDMALAQHAFIRSITLLSNSVAWCNLGIMYFMQGRTDLANKAFQEAQNQDPTYLQVGN